MYKIIIPVAAAIFLVASLAYPAIAATSFSVGSNALTGTDDLIYGHGGASTGNLFNLLNNGGASFIVDKDGNLNLSGSITSGGFSGTLNAGNISSGEFGSNTGGGNYTFPSELVVDGYLFQNDKTDNLIRDPDFSDMSAWTNEGEYVIETDTLPNGQIVNVMKITTETSKMPRSLSVPYDRNKTYRFSIWIKEDASTDGTRYFGLDAYNSADVEVGVYTSAGALTTNPYFWGGDFSDGEWHYLSNYLVPNNHATSFSCPIDAYGACFRSHAEGANMVIRFGNYSYSTGTAIASFALPTIEEVDVEMSTGITMRDQSLLIQPGGGNVGINDTTPSYKLDVNGTGRFTGVLTSNSDHVFTNYGIGPVGTYSATRYQQVFGMGTAYTIADDGTSLNNLYGIAWTHENIGGESIAGLSHQALFVEAGDTRVAIGRGIWTKYNITGLGGTFTNPVSVGTPTASAHATTKAYVDSAIIGGDLDWTISGNNQYSSVSGNVGIGTTSPASKLHISGTVAGGDPFYATHFSNLLGYGVGTGLGPVRITLGRNSTVHGYIEAGSSSDNDSSNGYMAFGTRRPVNSVTEAMRIDKFGNVGIGTTTPAYKLDVAGNARFASGDNSYAYYGPNSTWGGKLYVGATTSKVASQTAQVITTDGNLHIDAATSKNIYISFYNTAGKVGIGKSPGYTLDVNGAGYFANTVTVATPTASTHATTKSYVDGLIGGGVGTGISGQTLRHDGSSWVANSLLYNDGTNIGIGTTSPTDKFQVTGGYILGDLAGHLSSKEGYNLVYDTFDGYSNGSLIGTTSGWAQATGNIWTWTDGKMRSTSPNGDWGYEVTSPYDIQVDSYSIEIDIFEPADCCETYRVYFGDGYYIWYGYNSFRLYYPGGSNIIVAPTESGYRTVRIEVSPQIITAILYSNVGAAPLVVKNTTPLNSTKGVIKFNTESTGYFDNLRVDAVNVVSRNSIPKMYDLTRLVHVDNIGIGTTNPTHTLDVNGTGYFSNVVTVATPTSDPHAATKAYVDSAIAGGDLDWTISGNNQYSSVSGNVGIGVVSPSEKLEVAGTGYFSGNFAIGNDERTDIGTLYVSSGDTTNPNLRLAANLNSDDSWIRFQAKNSGGSAVYADLGFNPDNRIIYFKNPHTAAESLVINSSGNIGINDATPTYKLDVNGTGRFINTVTVATPTAGSHATTKDYVDGIVSASADLDWTISGSNQYSGVSGNVGIGTTSPVYKLEVAGDIRGNLAERINSVSTRITNPKEGYYFTTDNVHTGAIAITLPSKMSDAMISFWVDVYDYYNNETFSVFISGYPYSTAGVWANTSALILGSASNRNFNIRFGGSADNTRSIIYIGETSSVWNHPQVTVRDVMAGFSSNAAEIDNLPWDVTFETTLLNVNKTRTNNFPYADWNRSINRPSGTANYITKWTGTNSQGNSTIFDNGTNVGIGTTTMSAKLHVNGTGYFANTVTVATPTASTHATTKSYVDGLLTAGDADWAGVGGDPTLTGEVYHTGNVGIGTINPNRKLHVIGAMSLDGSMYIDTDTGVQPLYITRSGGDTQSLSITVDDSWVHFKSEQDEDSAARGGFIFNMDNDGTQTPYFNVRLKSGTSLMTLESTGELGLGIDLPTSKLHVMGTGYFSNTVTVATPTASTHAATKSYVDGLVSSEIFRPTRNMDPDPEYAGLNSFTNSGGWSVAGPVNTLPIGRYYYTTTGTGQLALPRIPIDVTKNYRASLWAKTTSGTGVTYMTIYLWDKDGVAITGGGTYWWYVVSGQTLPTTWTKYTFVAGPQGANNFPANAAYMSYGISHPNYASSGPDTYHVAGMSMEEETGWVSHSNKITYSDGNVGIGTTSPAYLLDVTSNSSPQITVHNTGGAGGAGFQFIDDLSSSAFKFKAISTGGFKIRDNNAGNDILLIENGASANSIYIDNLGNVGINTNNPAYKLDVNGTARFTNPVIVATPTASTHATTKSYVDGIVSASADLDWTISGSNQYSGVSGNVGIGITSPATKLDVNGDFRQANVTRGYSAYSSIGVNNYKTVVLNLIDGETLDWSAVYKINIAVSGDTSTKTGATYLVWDSSSYSGDARIWNIRMVSRAGTASNHVQARLNGNTVEVYHTHTGTFSIAAFVEKFETNNQSSPSFLGADYMWQRDISNLYYTDGNVGINDSTPTYKLDVNGTARFTNPVVVATPTATTHATTKSYVDGLIGGGVGTGTSGQTLRHNGTNWIANSIIYNNGTNVGIGTTAPESRLVIDGWYGRTAHDNGGLVGSYNNVGTNSTNSNPIYVIGSSYKPGSTILENMYGIGYTKTDASFLSGSVSSWGMYLAADGDARAFIAATSGGNSYFTAGNVGIGDTTPTYKLDVNGTGRFTGALTVGSTGSFSNTVTVATPTSGSHATTKDYVDGVSALPNTAKYYLKHDDLDSFLNIDDNMTITEVAEALGTSTSLMTKVDDSTAPAPGAFEVSGYKGLTGSVYWKVDQDSEYIFETWIKVVSSTATPQRFYAGWEMYNASKVSYGNVQRYWGSSATEYDSNSYNDGQWHHVVARISGVGASTGNFIDGTEYARLVLLFNYNSGDTITRYAGMKLYKSKRIFTSIYAKDGAVSTVDSDGKLVIDYSGNVYPNNLTVSGTATVATPLSGSHATTKDYVDTAVAGAGGLSGSGTTNYISKWTGVGSLGNSIVFDNGTNVGIGDTTPARKLDVAGDIRSQGNVYTDNNYGNGLVGVYSATRYQGVFAMGDAYKLGVDGLTMGNLYGIAWTHSNMGGQSKSGLGHQALFVSNDVTQTAIGTGVWTLGGYTQTGSSANTFTGASTFSQPVVVATPTATTHATTKSYVDAVLTNPVITGDLNMGGNDITNVNKLTVNTIDPLYNINSILYSSYAASMVGGVKEEYVGKTFINRYNNEVGEYEYILDVKDIEKGSDLWLWYKVIDFSKDNVEVFITPYGKFANVYYKLEDNNIVFRSDRAVEISYRLIANRFDWKSWPTLADDQNQIGGLIIK